MSAAQYTSRRIWLTPHTAEAASVTQVEGVGHSSMVVQEYPDALAQVICDALNTIQQTPSTLSKLQVSTSTIYSRISTRVLLLKISFDLRFNGSCIRDPSSSIFVCNIWEKLTFFGQSPQDGLRIDKICFLFRAVAESWTLRLIWAADDDALG